MSRSICFVFAMVVCSTPLWCQVEPSATGGSGGASDDTYMTMPAAVSGSFYRTFLGSHRESYLSYGVGTTASYDDNIWGGTNTPVSGEMYTVYPMVAIETSTGRTSGRLDYDPGFIFYEPLTALDQVTQNLSADFSYKLSPRTTLSGQEMFSQNSSVFSQPYTLAGSTISGSSESTPIVIFPYGGEINDTTGANLGYQFSRDSMIGGRGYVSLFRFTNSTQDSGLYDSTSYGGSGFYTRRFGRGQYMGVRYGYWRATTDGYSTTSQSQSGSLFYEVNLGHSFAFSVNGGANYVTITSQGYPASNTWAPTGSASFGWQGRHTNVDATYGRAVSTGWGFVGAYKTDTLSLSIGQQLGRRLEGRISGNYADVQNLASFATSSTESGHSLFGRASLEYSLTEHISVATGYVRVHQNYAGFGQTIANPDADQVFVSLNYQFRRPLGR